MLVHIDGFDDRAYSRLQDLLQAVGYEARRAHEGGHPDLVLLAGLIPVEGPPDPNAARVVTVDPGALSVVDVVDVVVRVLGRPVRRPRRIVVETKPPTAGYPAPSRRSTDRPVPRARPR